MTTLALGAMNFGKRTPADESERIVARALDLGVTVYDTANVYNDGESERILGKALGARRKDVKIATKVGFARVNGKQEGLTKASISSAIDGSLQRLGTDHVDFYYLHAPDHATPIEESLDAMHALITVGKVLAWGVSNHASWQILEMRQLAAARGLPMPAIAQQLYNVLIRQLDVEYFAYAKRFPIHTTVYNPLAGGLLTGKHQPTEGSQKGGRFDGNKLYQKRYWSDVMFERVAALAPVAAEAGLSLLELAYAWVAQRPGVDSILVGPGTVAHLDDAAAACAKTLTPATLARIDELQLAFTGSDATYAR